MKSKINTKIWEGNLDLRGNKTLTDLGQLTSIGGDANFENSKIKSLGNLQTIGGNANFENSKITNLGNLTRIGGSAYFENSIIKNLGQLKEIGGWADFENSNIEDLGNLTSIGGWAEFGYSNIEDLGNLTRIGGSANFYSSNIEDLGQLTNIGGNANFEDSQIKNLGKLTSIGGWANFDKSQIKNLGNLKEIKGEIHWGNRTDLKEQWEKRQTKAMKIPPQSDLKHLFIKNIFHLKSSLKKRLSFERKLEEAFDTEIYLQFSNVLFDQNVHLLIERITMNKNVDESTRISEEIMNYIYKNNFKGTDQKDMRVKQFCNYLFRKYNIE